MTEIITTKEMNVATDAIFETWLLHFGQPWIFLQNNGGEFVHEVYKELCEEFKIDFVILTLSQQRALYWALTAKNLLCINNGYSPNRTLW